MSGRLVYFVSAGHSGSTLLDIVIGTIPGAFSCGELTYRPWRLYRRGDHDSTAVRQDVCRCFRSFRECPVWSEAVEQVSARVGFDVFDDPFRFRMALLASQRYTEKASRWTQALRLGYRFTCRNMTANRRWHRQLQSTVDNNWLVIDTICETQDVQVVVDSTKDPLRLRMLHQGQPGAVHAILLVRDSRGVAYSAQKCGGEPIRAAASWQRFYERALTVLQGIQGLRLMRVYYEALCRNPRAMRRQIEALLVYPNLVHRHGLHMVAGDPIRYRWTGEVRMGRAWRDAFTGAARAQVHAMVSRLGEDWPQIAASA